MNNPRKVIVKTLITKRNLTDTFDFFDNVKNWETGGALKSINKVKDGWWSVETPLGNARVKPNPNKQFGILDHEFVGGGLSWTIFVRVTPNGNGSTVTWTFICPEKMPEDQFEEQLENFDHEITGWKNALES